MTDVATRTMTDVDGSNRCGGSRDYRRPTSRNSGLIALRRSGDHRLDRLYGPGQFRHQYQAGSRYGYLLLWVVVLANVTAMLFQGLSAKLGIVTGKSLAEQCRDHFPRPVVYAMWGASEIAAMATDLAEFLGASIGLSLLCGLPPFWSLAIVGVAIYAMLMLQGSGFRPIEVLIAGFVSVIGVSYLIELAIAPPDWSAFAFHSVVPGLAGPHSVTLAVGIVGATVMPHAIYLHSSLTKDRVPVHDNSSAIGC